MSSSTNNNNSSLVFPEFVVHENKVYRLQRDAMVCSYSPVEPAFPVQKPGFYWAGGRIPLAVWRQILSFFQWSYATHKSESQVRLHYNVNTQEWKAWAHPQYSKKGMTTEELPADDPRREKDNALFGDEWQSAGTVHHHCTTSAFQSGTDRSDETLQSGLHITVGKIDQKSFDLHARVTYGAAHHDVIWRAWFLLPPDLENDDALSQESKAGFLETYLKTRVPDNYPFPEEWKANIYDSPKHTTTTFGGTGVGGTTTTYPSGRTVTHYGNSPSGTGVSSGSANGNVGSGFGPQKTPPPEAPENCWHTAGVWFSLATGLRTYGNNTLLGRHHAVSWACWLLKQPPTIGKSFEVAAGSETNSMELFSKLVEKTGFDPEGFAQWCLGGHTTGQPPELRKDCGISIAAKSSTPTVNRADVTTDPESAYSFHGS